MKRILVSLTVVALMTVMLAMSAAPAFAQGAEANFGAQSVSVTVTQSNEQNQTLNQTSQNNTATATSTATATVTNTVGGINQTQQGTIIVDDDDQEEELECFLPERFLCR